MSGIIMSDGGGEGLAEGESGEGPRLRHQSLPLPQQHSEQT